MLTVKTIIETVYQKWSEAVKTKVGENYSMENSTIVNTLPYATCYFMGIPTGDSALEGGELSVNPSVQIDIYTEGQRALTKAYEIDEISHSAMLKMNFIRSYGPELIQSTNQSIKRLTSRYTRLVGLGETI